MNKQIIRDVVGLKRELAKVNDEIPDAAITLTRTAVQAITTAGTIIVWQSRIRGQGITWSGSNITIPALGWYHISMAWVTSAALTSMTGQLYTNGVLRQTINTTFPSINGGTFTFMRYFQMSDTVQIGLVPNINVNLNVRSESVNAESPILNIVQLTNQAEV